MGSSEHGVRFFLGGIYEDMMINDGTLMDVGGAYSVVRQIRKQMRIELVLIDLVKCITDMCYRSSVYTYIYVYVALEKERKNNMKKGRTKER